MLQKSFFSVAVSRIARKNLNFRRVKVDKPDAYDVCIKAKAIARTAGAEQALSFSLNQQGNLIKSSKPVLLNTVLTALSQEGRHEKFWEVVGAKVEGNYEIWSPELIATLLNQICNEMQCCKEGKSVDLLMERATKLYIESLERLKNPSHLHIHNAYLKCLSRHSNLSYLLWLVNEMTRGGLFKGIDFKLYGVKEYLPISESSLKLVKAFSELKKPVDLDAQSLTSILSAVSRSREDEVNLIQVAESIWSHFQTITPKIKLDLPCYIKMLLVYRNDLSRIFNSRKLIRSTSWRQRKLDRVLELIKEAKVDLTKDPKTLSIYFEICLNARLKEKIGEFMAGNPKIRTGGDRRLLELMPSNKR